MRAKDYPEDYKGPKAGVSLREEWQKITEYQAYKHIRFGDWNYSDFDCWLGTRDEWHYNRGSEDVKEAFEQMQKIVGIKSKP